MQITVETWIDAPPEEVWTRWTSPEDIKAWNAASEDWHTTAAEVDLREGGHFSSRMEAKDGSFGFDFGGEYTRVEPHERLESVMADGRRISLTLTPEEGGTRVTETFDAEETHTVEMQREGWQAILDNFRRHVEAARA